MWPLIFAGLSALGSAFYLWADWNTSKDIEDSVSQMEYYIDLLSQQMTIEEFLAGAWPSFVAIGLVLLMAFVIATPQRRKEARA